MLLVYCMLTGQFGRRGVCYQHKVHQSNMGHKHYTYWKQYKNQLKLQLGTVEHIRQIKCGNGPNCGNYLANRAAEEAA